MEKLFTFNGWIVCILAFACSTVQPVSKAKTQVPIKVQTATVDAFGDVYYANLENEVIKVNTDQRQLGYFSNNRLGDIGYIDVTNPLKVLVFYPDFYTVVVLDRQLNETGRFDLIQMGFGEIESVGASRDGTLWLFDDRTQRIKKVDQQGQVLLEGEDLRLRFNERIKPIKIKEFGNRILLNVPSYGILIFDLFGQFDTRIDVQNIDDFQCLEDRIIFTRSGKLEIYNLTDFLTTYEDLPDDLDGMKYLLYDQYFIAISQAGIRWSRFPEKKN